MGSQLTRQAKHDEEEEISRDLLGFERRHIVSHRGNLDIKNLFHTIVVQHGDNRISSPADTAVLPARISACRTSVVRVGPMVTLLDLSKASLAKINEAVTCCCCCCRSPPSLKEQPAIR